MSNLRFMIGLALAAIAGDGCISAYATDSTRADYVEIDGVYNSYLQGKDGNEASSTSMVKS